MTDAAFIWSTNIGDVAAQIEAGLGRIRRAVNTGLAGTGGGVLGERGDFLGKGVEQRARNIAATLDRDLRDVARRYEQGMRKAAAAGEPFRGITTPKELGGVTSASFRELTAPLVATAQRNFANLGGEVGRALQGPLQGLRPDFQRYLQGMATNTFQATRELVSTIGQQMGALRGDLGVTGVRTQQFAVGGRAAEREFVQGVTKAMAASATSAPDRLAQDAAIASLVRDGGYDATDAKALVKQLNVERAKVDAAVSNARRVVNEIRKNTDPQGRPIDPRGARLEGGTLIDSGGRRYQRERDDEGRVIGLSQLRDDAGPLGELDAAARQWRENAQVQRRSIEEISRENKQLGREQKNINVLEGRAAARSLIAAEAAGEAVIAGGRYAQRGDDFFRLDPRLGTAERIDESSALDRRNAEQAIQKELENRTRQEQNLRREQERRATAEKRAAAGARPPGAPPPGAPPSGFRDEFGASLSGQRGRGFRVQDVLGSVMQYGRYILSAAVVGGTIKALAQARAAVVDYRDSLTDLEIAVGANERVANSFIESLSDVSRLAGANTGDAIDAAVRGIRAFAEIGDTEGTERVGSQFAETAAQLAVIAEKDLRNATGDLIAVGSAFDLTVESFSRVTDAVAIAKRQLGGDAAEISQGLAAVGTSAAAVGFTLEETANLISLVQARTDQTGRAVATRLSRAFSIIGGSGGQSAIEALNRQLEPDQQIDTAGSVRDQLLQVSQIYNDLTVSQQGLIRNALGGTANVRELLPILTSPEQLAEAMNAQFTGAGAGLDEFNRKANDLVGILRKVRGDIQGIITGLFQMGAFDVFAVLLKYGFEPLLNLIRSSVNAVNSLVGAFRDLNPVADVLGKMATSMAILVVQLRLASKAIAFLQGVGLLQGRVGQFLSGSSIGSSPPVQRTQSPSWGMFPFSLGEKPASRRQRLLSSRADGIGMYNAVSFNDINRMKLMTASMAGMTEGLRALGASFRNALTSLGNFIRANPMLVIVGGILAFNQALRSTREVLDQSTAVQEVLSEPRVSGSELPLETELDFRNYAQELSAAAQEAEQARSGFFNTIANWFQGDPLGNLQAQAEARSSLALEQADNLERARRDVARSRDPAGMFDLRTTEGAADGLKLLAEQGRDAATRFDALREAMQRLGDQADGTRVALDQVQRLRFGQELAQDVARRFGTSADQIEGRSRFRATWNEVGLGRIWGSEAYQDVSGARNFIEQIDEDFLTEMNDFLIDLVDRSGGLVGPEERPEIIAAVQEYVQNSLDGYEDFPLDLRHMIDQDIMLAVNMLAESFADLEDPRAAVQAYLAAAMPEARGKAEILGVRRQLEGGDAPQLQQARNYVEYLRELEADAIERDAQREDMELLYVEIDRAELAAQQALAQWFQLQGSLAVSRMSPTMQVSQLREQINVIDDQLRITKDQDEIDRLTTERNGLEFQLSDAERERASAQRRAGIDSRDRVGRAMAEATSIYEELVELEARGDTESAAYWEAKDRHADALLETARAEADLALAERSAYLDPRDAVGNAAADLEAAREALELEKEGTEGWFVAFRALREAQESLARVASARAQAERRAYTDPQDVVANAVADLEDARDALELEKEGTEAWFVALRGVREAQDALARAELGRIQSIRASRRDPRDELGRSRDAIRGLYEDLAITRDPGERADILTQIREEQLGQERIRRETRQAQRAASIDPRSGVQRAAENVRSAQEDLNAALPGTREYWDSVRELNEAMIAYADAQRAAALTAILLGGDITDSVFRAEAELRDATRARQDAQRQGAPSDVINDLLLAEEEAFWTVDAARFDRWISDLNTARQLGRISEQAYIAYLEEESRRLNAIADRTRQQQEQLNQVDLALQAAREQLEGQFNIGDIRIPTPFEVRRAVAAQAVGMDPAEAAFGSATTIASATTNVQENTIYVNGADTQEVGRILAKLLGSSAMGQTTVAASGSRRL